MPAIRFDQVESLAPGMADEYRDAFSAANVDEILDRYGISRTPLRICHFIAQVLTETGGLKALRESLDYSPTRLMAVWPRRFPTLAVASAYAHDEEKLGEFVYGGRLGNVHPGDGYLYRGRGLLQITGREAYARFGERLGIDLPGVPDLAFAPAHALEIAAAEWAASGCRGRTCNDLADSDDIRGVTRAINGGETGLEDRIDRLSRCKRLWMAADPQGTAARTRSGTRRSAVARSTRTWPT